MRAAIYAQVSGSRQEQEQTIDSQLDALRVHVREQSWVLDERHVYTDNGVSGCRLDRPGLDGLRDTISEGQVDVVVVSSPDRLARSFVHQWVLMEDLQKHGVSVVFLNRPISNTAEDQLLLQVQGAIAEYERAKILERTRRGRLYKARTGAMLGWARAPFGYRCVRGLNRRVAEVDEAQAMWVRKMFEWLLSDSLGCRQIASRLTEAGVPPPRRAHHWYPSTVALILKNSSYMGRAYYNRRELTRETVTRGPGRPEGQKRRTRERPREEWIEIRVPGIVDATTFQRAQMKLKTNKQESARRTRPGEYLLRGLLRCGACGGRMNGYRNLPHGYYACIASRDPVRTASGTKCTNRPVRADFLDQFVWDHLQSLLVQPGILENQLREQRNAGVGTANSYQAQTGELDKQIAAQTKRIERLLELYEDGSVDMEIFKERQQVLRGKIEGLERERAEIRRQQEESETHSRLLEGVETFRTAIQSGITRANFNDRQKICRLVMEQVDVNGEEIVIKHLLPTMQNTSL